jgi:hypothetical protein
MNENLKLLWGDIHNHNEMGYGQGSLDRSYQIARSHLDFYAFTPHAQHADGNAPNGYPIVNENWEAIQDAARSYNDPGTFTTFLHTNGTRLRGDTFTWCMKRMAGTPLCSFAGGSAGHSPR